MMVSLKTCPTQITETIPKSSPKASAPNATRQRNEMTSPALNFCPSTICRYRRNTTIAVPSFMRDSPSIRVLNFLLAPNSFNNATTATGSVALSRPPSKSPVLQFQSYGNILTITTPRKKVDITTPGAARRSICTKPL
ncbi:hypothetical protein KC19_5G019300, partial [Ceratodon purpureus]